MSKSNILVILPLFLVIFLDTLGTALVIPLLSPLFIDHATSILPFHTDYQVRTFLYGLTLGIYSIATFFGAPLLGDLSDKIGRKHILMICLSGALIGYILSAVGVVLHSATLLILGRVVDGFTAGSLSTAQAAIIDISPENRKTTYIGYILLAVSLGSMLGPLFGGTLSNPRWSQWFTLTTPLYFAAIITFLNMVFLQFAFKETFVPTNKSAIRFFSGFSVFTAAFKVKRLCILTFAFLFLQLGWATYFQFVGLFLTLRYHFTPNMVGVFLACIGAGFTLAFCYLLTFLTQHFALRTLAISITALMSLFMLAIVLISNQLSAWILSVPAAAGLAIAYSVIVSMFSNAVDKDKQGWVMGLTGAIGAFAFGISGLLAGIIIDLGVTIPIWFAGACLLGCAITIYFSKEDATVVGTTLPHL